MDIDFEIEAILITVAGVASVLFSKSAYPNPKKIYALYQSTSIFRSGQCLAVANTATDKL